MARYGTNGEVISAFFDKSYEPSVSKSGSVIIDFTFPAGKPVLLSYGWHFPMAFYADRENGLPVLILNGDRYSITTGIHQGMVLNRTFDEPNKVTVSMSAVYRAIDWTRGGVGNSRRWSDYRYMVDIDKIVVLDFWKEEHSDTEIEDATAVFYRKLHKADGTTERVPYRWHRAGFTLFKVRECDHLFIAGMDGQSYFVSAIDVHSYVPKTVEEALEALRPDVVKKALKDKKKVMRQGEWFFVREDDLSPEEEKEMYQSLKKDFVLPRELAGNPHIATRGKVFDDRIVVSGSIRHPEHRMLRLSKATQKTGKIWLAYKNAAVASWSEAGVD